MRRRTCAWAYKPTVSKRRKSCFTSARSTEDRDSVGLRKKAAAGRKVNLAIYADASYFLMYRQVFFDVTNSVLHSNGNVEWVRFVSKRRPAETGRGAEQSGDDLRKEPVQSVRRLCDFHHAGHHHGHHPADAADRDRHGRRNVARAETVPDADTRRRKRLAVLPMVSGKTVAYLSVYCLTLLYVLGVHYRIFGYPMNGSWER